MRDCGTSRLALNELDAALAKAHRLDGRPSLTFAS